MAAIAQAPVAAHQLSMSNRNELPKLRSNKGEYVDAASIGWMRPTSIDAPLDEIRQSFEQHGYVWMKSVIPREDVLDMRQHYFEHMSPTGILEPGTNPRDGIFNSSQEPIAHIGVGPTDLPEDAEKVRKLAEAHESTVYQTFLHHPKLRKFIREFMGWNREKMVLRNLLRHNVPNGLSTGVHYDKLFLRAGEDEFLTAWIPIGDVSASGGGLTYLEGSTALGKSMEAAFTKSNADLPPEERISGFNVRMNRDGQLGHDVDTLGREYAPGLEQSRADFQSDVIVGGGAGGKGWKQTGNVTAGTPVAPNQSGFRWLVADYEAGDVVFHNPYMIHGACKNEDPSGRIRLSSDVRFYEEGAKCDERWCQRVWAPDDGL